VVIERVIWKPVITSDLAAEAVRVARDVCGRLSSPERVAVAAAAARGQTSFPNSTHWIPHTISQGYAGLAVLWGYLDSCFPLEGWDIIGREHLDFAVRGAETVSGLPVGLFSGLSGLAFGALQLSRHGTRYRRLLETLDQTIAPQTVAMANSFRAQHGGVGFGDFDVISGLSGVGAYLLCRRDQSAASVALSMTVESLIELTEADGPLPRWHTPPSLLWDDEIRAIYPHGNLNCGLAHGIPGPLALLSLEHQGGCSIPGLPQAIARIADWLCQSRCDDSWGINWPTAVSIVKSDTSGDAIEASSTEFSPDVPSRCAWCYGSPGVARALWLAGEALDRNDYRELAISAMEAVFRRPVATRRINSPTFCHGVAGLLAITLRFANDTGAAVFTDASRTLVEQLLDSYQPESLLGYRNIEFEDQEIDQPGLLDGAPAVPLVLLAAATRVEPTWDRLFLLS
jgi:lantibiotic biosynthesis protein